MRSVEEQDNARLRADLQTSLASGAEMGVALVRDASVKALGEVAKMGLSPRAPRRFSNPCVRCPAEPGTPSEPMSR
ncbi:unnamed protein product [Effrenium voratum]|uniref:Uncharacterized protein n=1 Tax=Effrenium voratum TaxID=2562239 RepID=A0AA36HKC2_9DINO|nr:unnamed protein product [Effrenium voratum]